MSKGGVFLDFFGIYASPLGPLLLQSDGVHLTGLYLNREAPGAQTALPVFDRTRQWLDAYFRGQSPSVTVPLLLRGTPFQQQVWDILLTIPFGQTRTYGDIAREMAVRLGRENMSAQAVGQAVGKNPVSILVPCHRCVGTGGKLTGYAGGIENKKWLLCHEGWQIQSDKVI